MKLIQTEQAGRVLAEVLDWSDAQAYRGYNKHDGLNSPVLAALCGWHKWLRLIAIQTVMRCPVNLRPLLRVPRTYNPKGLALFAQAWLDRYRYAGQQQDLVQAEALLDLLLNNSSSGDWSGHAWGYSYPWQDTGFFAPARTPNAVVTAFVCEALLDAYEVTGKVCYLDAVNSAIHFLLTDLPVLKDTDSELCLAYMPLPMSMRVMDVSILAGSVIARHAALAGDARLAPCAARLINYVMNRQTDYGAWYYTDPPAASHITHDNYHTGFILDALWRYMTASGNKQWESDYYRGLKFYAEKLFTGAGAPKWMYNRDYPFDIHGAAQGIITFSRHQDKYPGLAGRILDWTLTHMYRGNGRFAYQIHRYYRKNYTLLRWCNGWMSRALAQYILQTSG
jgi:hypothetical protein